MITATALCKKFFIPDRVKGPFGAIRGLVQRTGHTVVAVDNVGFSITPGEFVGYIGPNGAGKSTTIKMLTGILHPTSGSVEVMGLSPQQHRAQVVKNLGVVFGQRTQLWWDLPLIESFELLAAMYNVSKTDYAARLRQFSTLLGLDEFWHNPVRKLSLGQRMRGDICAALLHRPQILFLDEPTIGLDVVAKNSIREFLREINQDGVTILLTTHDLGDVEKLCRRVMVINHGQKLFDGTLDALRRQIGVVSQLILDFEEAIELSTAVFISGVRIEQPEATRLVIEFDRCNLSPNALLQHFAALGEIKDIHIAEPDIEVAVAKLF